MEVGEHNGSVFRHLRQEQLLCRPLCSSSEEHGSITKKLQPLRILDLPVDVLEAIIKEVTHTNDLTSLALTHSALHALVIPHIYSRFDIVWPELNSEEDRRVGVDALTYGLSTLVKAHDVFGEDPSSRASSNAGRPCAACGKPGFCFHKTHSMRRRKIRRGNNFAEYTRKFSLGNGPAEWVQDYAITKESGKMLGTLVALAVGRMRNLEAFIFDMPTGVLRDVWLALASLADREDGGECRLQEVRVRWHDNSMDNPQLEPQGVMGIPSLSQPVHGSGTQSTHITYSSLFDIPPYPRVEFPTFSILPPLRSIGALDMDESSYVEEMSILIEVSVEKLRELRVGLAEHAMMRPWVIPLEDNAYGSSSRVSRFPRPGGILGILFARICDPSPSTPQRNEHDGTPHIEETALELESKTDMEFTTNIVKSEAASSNHLGSVMAAAILDPDEEGTEEGGKETDQTSEIRNLGDMLANQTLEEPSNEQMEGLGDRHSHGVPPLTLVRSAKLEDSTHQAFDPFMEPNPRSGTKHKLQLNILELERIPLSSVLSKAIDWTQLTTLTLLGCHKHAQLWTFLRKKYAIPSHNRHSSLSRNTPTSAHTAPLSSSSTPRPAPVPRLPFALQIRRIHTDTVTPSLLTFINTTLSPDTLEHLFLQASPDCKATVPISQIYRLVIRRHRASLRKLLIDSSIRPLPVDPEEPNITGPHDTTFHAWLFSRELLTAITCSGKMHLRELSLNLAQRDWHFFLQRLPQAKELRSLHIMRIAPESPRDHHHMQGHVRRPLAAPELNPRETAMQILDVVALRPEMELCYLGVGPANCYEIVEYEVPPRGKGRSGSFVSSNGASLGDGDGDGDVYGYEHGHGHGGDDDDAGGAMAEQGGNAEDSDVELETLTTSDVTTDEDESGSQMGTTRSRERVKKFKLRDILFYEDKVPIFKARHGRL